MARVPKKRRRRVATTRPQGRWTLSTYLQWAPVITVAIGLVASYVHQQDVTVAQGDRISALEKSQPTTQIAVELTTLRDRLDAIEKSEAKLETKQVNDYADLRGQIWARSRTP